MLRACQPLWRALFSAIDFNGDNIIDFEAVYSPRTRSTHTPEPRIPLSGNFSFCCGVLLVMEGSEVRVRGV